MTQGFDTNEGWYVGRKDSASEWKGGPYTWAQLVEYAAIGRVTPDDLVWHGSMPDWAPAASIPGLFTAPTVAAAPARTAARRSPAPGRGPAAARRGRRGWLIALGIVVAVVALCAIGGGAWWAWSTGLLGGGPGGGGPNLGVAQVTVPQADKLIKTQAYGEVPADQIGVVMKSGSGRSDAEKLAQALGGSVAGEIAYINAFQIQFPGATEADLKKAIDAAHASGSVEFAFPNQQSHDYLEIKGVRVDPYDDPMYGGGVGDGYKAAGVSKAWEYIRGSGIKLNDTHVGIVDRGLWAPGQGTESEFGGDVKIDFPDPNAARAAGPTMKSNGKPDPAGTHGTGVATIIGADPNNGGPAGIAGPLGKKLTISMINHHAGQYGNATATPDPNDPSIVAWSDGHSYSLGELVALKKEIESGARVINCSWGADTCSAELASAFKSFFVRMAAEHPDVTFVCAAGNSGGALDNRTSFPAGQDLANMITVGAINNDGTQAHYSTTAGDHYVVDIAAPGSDAVVGMASKGGAVQQDGTSFAAPHVTAAIAMLLSINPKLNAQQVKQILLETSRPGITVGEADEPDAHSNLAPPALGGKDLAIDQAVLKVINDMRANHQPKLDALTPEILEKMGVIDAVAITDSPGDYKVKGTVGAVGDSGTDVTIDVTGEDHAIGGSTTKHLSAPGDAGWDVTLPKDKGTVLVKRLDNGAASLITIESYNINGKWSGSFTVTDVKISDETAAKAEGCTAALFEKLKGKSLPMSMDITADESGKGSAETLIDVSSLNTDSNSSTSSEPQTYPLQLAGSKVTFDVSGAKGVRSMTAEVSEDAGQLTMNGVLTGGGKGWSIKAVFTVAKNQ